MLVKKGEYLVRVHEDKTATPFEVILADKEYFCVGEICFDETSGEMFTSLIDAQIYSNDEKIGCLKEYGFEKAEIESED